MPSPPSPTGLQIRAALQLDTSIGCLQSLHTCGDFKHDECLNLRPLWGFLEAGRNSDAAPCRSAGGCHMLQMWLLFDIRHDPRLAADPSAWNVSTQECIPPQRCRSNFHSKSNNLMDGGCYTSWSVLDGYSLILLAISYTQFVRDYSE